MTETNLKIIVKIPPLWIFLFQLPITIWIGPLSVGGEAIVQFMVLRL